MSTTVHMARAGLRVVAMRVLCMVGLMLAVGALAIVFAQHAHAAQGERGEQGQRDRSQEQSEHQGPVGTLVDDVTDTLTGDSATPSASRDETGQVPRTEQPDSPTRNPSSPQHPADARPSAGATSASPEWARTKHAGQQQDKGQRDRDAVDPAVGGIAQTPAEHGGTQPARPESDVPPPTAEQSKHDAPLQSLAPASAALSSLGTTTADTLATIVRPLAAATEQTVEPLATPLAEGVLTPVLDAVHHHAAPITTPLVDAGESVVAPIADELGRHTPPTSAETDHSADTSQHRAMPSQRVRARGLVELANQHGAQPKRPAAAKPVRATQPVDATTTTRAGQSVSNVASADGATSMRMPSHPAAPTNQDTPISPHFGAPAVTALSMETSTASAGSSAGAAAVAAIDWHAYSGDDSTDWGNALRNFSHPYWCVLDLDTRPG